MIRASFETDWFVAKGRDGTTAQVGPITVPHDAMLDEKRDPHTKNGGNTGFYPGGVYRYTKTFVAPETWEGRAVVLEFEGVYQRSEIYLNGQLVGGRPSGYALFHVTLTEHLQFGIPNVLEVIADNSSEPNSRWYSGSGIYRPVHLLIGGPVRIPPTGLRLSTAALVGTSATVDVRTTITSDSDLERVVTVKAELSDSSGALIATASTLATAAAHSTAEVVLEIEVPDAPLWSPETPRLATAEVSLIVDGDTVDSAIEEFGIRIVTADPLKGLQINGATVKLRGAAIHHDNGVIGAVALDAAEHRRVRILKESGYNAIRSAHNPASRALLRACDIHGMLVMDELTDAWYRPKSAHDYSEVFAEWWERDLEALVANAYNHPSVIMYSIGNEISETATARGIETNRTIARRTKKLDSTRLVTNSINGFLNLIAPQDDEKLARKAEDAKEKDEAPNKNLIRVLNAIMGILDKTVDRIVRLPAVDKRTRDAFADVDVAGYNYMVGRYKVDGRLHPDRLIVGSETRASLTPTIWKIVESLPFVIGDFAWTGWDYIGEAGLATKEYGTTKRQIYHPYPAMLAGEPVIDITGFRQTQSFVNEIGWHLGSGPHLAVEPVNHSGQKSVSTGWRATNSIASWSWEGCEGRNATVEVYSDAPKVSLSLNGRSLGIKVPGLDFLSTFTVPYEPGTLIAIAHADDGSEIGRSALVSAGSDLLIRAEPETLELRADGKDLAYIPISLVDAAGIVRPLADRSVSVTVEGAGSLAGHGSGKAITTEEVSSSTHETFNGRSLAVVRSTTDPGEIVVSIAAEGCATLRVALSSQSDGS